MNLRRWTFHGHRIGLCLGSLLLPSVVAAQAPVEAATVTFVHSFAGWPDGALPTGGLTLGPEGALYGTAQDGGIYGPDYNDGSPGNGTVFRIATDHGFSLLHSFTHVDGNISNADGRDPQSPLVVAPDGTVYGIAAWGGTYDGGVAFQLSPSAGFTALHYFGVYGVTQSDPLGRGPAGLTLGPAGRLFGVTSEGGSQPESYGVVFSLAEDGSQMQALQSFGGPDLEVRPASPLLPASDGQLYGVAQQMQNTQQFGGVLYRIAPDGSGFAILHRFILSTEGSVGTFWANTTPSVVEGSDGYLYGATSSGGRGTGALFRVAKDGSGFTILHRFARLSSSNRNQGGGDVQTALIFGADGLLYGATQYGGYSGNGVVFRLATDGSGFRVLYRFPAIGADKSNGVGANPTGNISFNPAGELCGTAEFGGRHALGTVWCLKPD